MDYYTLDLNSVVKYLNYKDNFKIFIVLFIFMNLLVDLENLDHAKKLIKYIFYLGFTFYILRYLGTYTDQDYSSQQEQLEQIHYIIERQYQIPNIEENIEPSFNPLIYWDKFNKFITNHVELNKSLDKMLSYQTINRDNVWKMIYLTYTLILMKLEDSSFYKQDELAKPTDFYHIYQTIKDYGKGIQLNLNCDYDIQIYLRKLQEFLINLKKVIF